MSLTYKNSNKPFPWHCVQGPTAKAETEEVWQSFHEVIYLNSNEAKVHCKTCVKIYDHPKVKDGNTSSMWKHFRKHAKSQNPLIQTQLKPSGSQDIRSFVSTQQGTSVGMTQSELEGLLLDATVECNWPFDQFEKLAFRKFVQSGFPGHKVPRRRAMRLRLKRAAEKARNELRQQFASVDSRISLALDCWTSPNRWEFMGN